MFSPQKHKLPEDPMGHYSHITFSMRKVIQKRYWSNTKFINIAEEIGIHPANVKREIDRNKDDDGMYRALSAQKKYDTRRSKQVYSKLFQNETLLLFVLEGILKHWSPEYISGRLIHHYPNDLTMRVSHELIYQWIYTLYHKEGIELWKYLPRKRKKRKKRQNKLTSRLKIEGKKSIHNRPEEVEAKEEIGHWEGDTVFGKNNDGYVVTLLERKTQLYLSAWMPDKSTDSCLRALQEAVGSIPNEKFKTITFDNGSEFSSFNEIEQLFECEVYFADPYSSWQRGSNERSNGLLRRYYPKGTSFKNLNEKELARNIKKINSMPRKMLNFLTPYEVFFNNSVALEN